MTEISGYFEAIKDRYALTSDYTLAEKLGIAQPDANLMRRGLKVPKPELCIKIAKLLDRNPVELLLIAQKDKAPKQAKEYWTLALTAVDVMLHVPKRPRYLPKKVEAIGRELKQLESQTLTYEGAAANAARLRLDQAQHHLHGHGRVGCRAAGAQHIAAGLGGQRVGRDHHVLLGRDLLDAGAVSR